MWNARRVLGRHFFIWIDPKLDGWDKCNQKHNARANDKVNIGAKNGAVKQIKFACYQVGQPQKQRLNKEYDPVSNHLNLVGLNKCFAWNRFFNRAVVWAHVNAFLVKVRF